MSCGLSHPLSFTVFAIGNIQSTCCFSSRLLSFNFGCLRLNSHAQRLIVLVHNLLIVAHAGPFLAHLFREHGDILEDIRASHLHSSLLQEDHVVRWWPLWCVRVHLSFSFLPLRSRLLNFIGRCCSDLGILPSLASCN